ncbi:MAG: polysaccharide biosynthesis/export family protein, partial [Saprospiraceae bacterium]
LGRTKLAGLTTKEANYFLEQRYSNILKDPIINVRVQNHFVTVLGEVNKPGRYSLDNELLSLVDIIALANGLSTYAKNDEIELVRIIENHPVKLTINLTDLASLPQKNITLQPNDIIHVGATSSKGQDRNLGKASLITGIVTGVAVIISVFAK